MSNRSGLIRAGYRDDHGDTVLDSFADLNDPTVLAALGFVRSYDGGRVVFHELDSPDVQVVANVPDRPVYRRPVVTVTHVAGWYERVSTHFVLTNSPIQGPLYLRRSTHSRNTHNTQEIQS